MTSYKYGSVPDLEADKERANPDKGPFGLEAGYGLTIVGAVLLFLVAVTPMWDSFILLNSSTYVFFVGDLECSRVISFCGAVIVFYILAMLLTTRFAVSERKTYRTFMYVFLSAIMLLGLGLLLFATPIRVQSTAAYNELMDCTGLTTVGWTQPLYYRLHAAYRGLLELRLQPDCINKVSVEQCKGYEAHNPYTGFLKEMELSYECSGFCYSGNYNNTATPVVAVLAQQDVVKARAQDTTAKKQGANATVVENLLVSDKVNNRERQRASKQQRQMRQQGTALHASGLLTNHSTPDAVPIWVKMPQGLGDTTNAMAATGWMNKYPPNLFTNANYKTTCDGAAARELRFGALETASLMYLEGAALLVISVFGGFMKLCSMRVKREA